MKLFVVLCLVAATAAAPQQSRGPVKYNSPNDAQILRYENDNIGIGPYKFFFEQSDGTKREEQGELRNQGQEDEYVAVQGSYSWVGPDGIPYTVRYTADDNGYAPIIEQPPGGAVPDAVVASLLG